jgi:hypothetical protein
MTRLPLAAESLSVPGVYDGNAEGGLSQHAKGEGPEGGWLRA